MPFNVNGFMRLPQNFQLNLQVHSLIIHVYPVLVVVYCPLMNNEDLSQLLGIGHGLVHPSIQSLDQTLLSIRVVLKGVDKDLKKFPQAITNENL